MPCREYVLQKIAKIAEGGLAAGLNRSEQRSKGGVGRVIGATGVPIPRVCVLGSPGHANLRLAPQPQTFGSSGKFVSGMPCCVYFPAEAQRRGEEDGNLNPHPKI